MHASILHILNTTKTRIQALGPQTCREGLDMGFEKRDFISAVADAKADGKVPVIAEVKPASPGRAFRDILPGTAAELAWEMEEAGAVAVSVLTEPLVFRGSLENLDAVRNTVCLPVLRKDFIIDRKQLDEVQSDLVLLIAGILGEELGVFVELAIEKGFEPLVEVHNKQELDLALKTAARIIGINNRDLETLKINLGTTEELAPIIRECDLDHGTRHLIISESGMNSVLDVRRVIQAGADAVLIGSALMESNSVFDKTKEFVQSAGWR
ncbi:indole-3-glycerol-phosphate synthase [Methanosarcina sp.]|uniref:indole-3-glycerol-phosphate synthase n=1 Tax=Methanosarcina sp. TaxID=2213 RepID=UPI0029880A6A|nr:indole-3-glycerol-phosphate synthase [Methanosarcina sp.]MDW5551746.1 indole-3-glycerol-phosphate synthase [Methanosarcina sp.]MDW5555130.1 indole-3-glycerol-phosphate synthase [Methanosarcina sp.]MDW5560816.1 indole-3-glycerol-phosphate synthase [Methanosarcina sp.]